MPPRGNAIQCEVHIDAPPEAVFAFLIEPDKMVRWMGVEADVEPRPGGRYHVNVTGRDIASGHFLEVTPFTRVVFSWGWEEAGHPVAPGASLVEVTLRRDGNGTLLTLVHSGLPEDTVGGHDSGWVHYLGRLVIAGAGGDPGLDPWTQAEPPAPASAGGGQSAGA